MCLVQRRVNKLTTGVLFLDTLQVFEVSCVCGCVSSFPACTRHKSISLVFPAPWVRCGAFHAQRCGRFPWFEGSCQNRPAVWRTLSQGTPARKMATISSREKDVRTQEGRTSAEALVVKLYEVVNWCDEEVRKNNKHEQHTWFTHRCCCRGGCLNVKVRRTTFKHLTIWDTRSTALRRRCRHALWTRCQTCTSFNTKKSRRHPTIGQDCVAQLPKVSLLFFVKRTEIKDTCPCCVSLYEHSTSVMQQCELLQDTLCNDCDDMASGGGQTRLGSRSGIVETSDASSCSMVHEVTQVQAVRWLRFLRESEMIVTALIFRRLLLLDAATPLLRRVAWNRCSVKSGTVKLGSVFCTGGTLLEPSRTSRVVHLQQTILAHDGRCVNKLHVFVEFVDAEFAQVSHECVLQFLRRRL